MSPKKRSITFLCVAFSAFAFGSCGPEDSAPVSKHADSQSQALNNWFNARYIDSLERSPMQKSYLEDTSAQSRLDDNSQIAIDETAALTQAWLSDMRRQFNPKALNAQAALSYRLFERDAQDQLETHQYSSHDYIFHQMGGPHIDLPSFMITVHQISSEQDARDYISRLSHFSKYLNDSSARVETQFRSGISPPKFVYPKLIQASRNVITGLPFTDEDGDSPLLSDFSTKISQTNLSEDVKSALIREVKTALTMSVLPAYQSLIEQFERHHSVASTDDGIWKLPDGENVYNARLRHYTTTVLTADKIHEIGLADVARIQGEMRDIVERIGFDGSLTDFFEFLRSSPEFTYSNDKTGRDLYLEQAANYIDTIRLRSDELFLTQPKAKLVVKRVEEFREGSAFGAFYDQPATDGSWPGTYYINLRDMSELPIYQMQALAYHEGVPGHHMQIAQAMELEDIPKFRTSGGHTAYVEGWALYSESLPKELGLYVDPYQEFGQLSMEIFRSARLVLDTGIHSKKWTREQAVKYMLENTANSEADIRAEVDRYIVWPGQATAYKIGMLKIQELRRIAEVELAQKFDIRQFHEAILADGSMPLDILETQINTWINREKQE